jgi:hypothetical protein
MRNDIHAQALSAAARVAFSITLLGGCSAADLAGSEPTPDDEPTDLGSTEQAASAGKAKPAPKPVAKGKACHKDVPAPKTRAQCEQTIAASFPEDAGWPLPDDARFSDANIIACCDLLIAAHDAEIAKGNSDSFSWPERTTCCGGVHQWSKGGTCTPWGPPVPPSMRPRLA